MATQSHKLVARLRRKRSLRKKIVGTGERPRLSFYKSLRALSVQAIDDDKKHTLIAHSVRTGTNKAAASALAKKFAADEKAKQFSCYVFDRNGRAYHGVVQQFCDTLREHGIKI